MSAATSHPGQGPRLRLVTGKGGVGKTAIATALAVRAARNGERVLLAETHGRDRVAQLLGAKPVGPDLREVRENLFVVDMNPRAAIREYALLVLKFEAVYNAVFENRLVRHLIRLVPALGELVMLGKIWYHAQEQRDDGSPRFDRIILDAPATGHAISMFRTPAAVERTVPPGAMRDNARLIRDMLTSPAHTALHIVTTPEEMPVAEAIELEQAASDLLGMRLGTTFINQRVPRLPHGSLEALAPLAHDPTYAALHRTLAERQHRTEAGEAHLERLPAYMLLHSVSLPRLALDDFHRDAVDRLATVLEQQLREAW